MPLYVYRHRPGSSVGVARNQNRKRDSSRGTHCGVGGARLLKARACGVSWVEISASTIPLNGF